MFNYIESNDCLHFINSDSDTWGHSIFPVGRKTEFFYDLQDWVAAVSSL